MASKWHKFYLVGAVGGQTPTVEDLYYNWAVIHTILFLGSSAPINNFLRYAQNFVQPDVPNEARLINGHPSVRYRIFADHWTQSWDNTVQTIMDPSHENRLGRHHFGDPASALAFFGHGGAVYKSPGFANPAGLTIGHWLTLPQGVTRTEAIARLEPHKLLLKASFEEFGKSAKYTLDICDDAYEKQVKESVLRILPRGQYYAIELLQFTSRADGFDFSEKYRLVLRASYNEISDVETSFSVYGGERIVLDYTDDNPSTKTPLPIHFTDESSLEYKMQHNDWLAGNLAHSLLEGTKWSAYVTSTDHEKKKHIRALDPENTDDWN